MNVLQNSKENKDLFYYLYNRLQFNDSKPSASPNNLSPLKPKWTTSFAGYMFGLGKEEKNGDVEIPIGETSVGTNLRKIN